MNGRRSRSGQGPEPTRIGSLRPSQMIHTFGPGSVVDLPSMSVVVGGIDDWNTRHTNVIAETRLLRAVRALPDCSRVAELRTPPWKAETTSPYDEWAWVGVPVHPFPRWMRCTRCSRLASVDQGLFTLQVNPYRPDRSRWYHDGCHGSRPQVVPTRFMVACPGGHLDDFPWNEYAHGGSPCPDGAVLELREVGRANRSTDVRVVCKTCESQRLAHDAFGEESWRHLPRCRARHPHLQQFEETGCQERTRALLLGASNSWFSIYRSALTIPTAPGSASRADRVEELVNANWHDLNDIENRVVFDYVIGRLKAGRGEQQRRWMLEHPSDEIWAAIERRRGGDEAAEDDGGGTADRDDEAVVEDLRGPEWAAFTASPPQHSDEFRTRHLEVPNGFEGTLDRPIAVDRLREVMALCGFTRIDGPDDTGAAERIAPLWKNPPTWLPAAESRGEGLLVRLREPQVQSWEAAYEADERYRLLLAAHRGWRARRGLHPQAAEPRARFLLLHSLAHMLIHQVALDCGYSTASIRERLYSRTPDEGDPMAGVLLYTASPDSEGTLGGLVALAEPNRLEATLHNALERAGLCSTDPMCADHLASDTEDALHHAACHACLFVPETSCEHGNRYLDRATAAPVLGDPISSYFMGNPG